MLTIKFNYDMLIPPEGEEEEQPPEEDLEDDKSFLVKNGLKGRKK